MTRYFTHYWANKTWENAIPELQGELLNHTAGNKFEKGGVHTGDVIYVITVIKGILYLLGKMVIKKICNIDEAAAYLNQSPETLWEANEHIISDLATPMNFDLTVPLTVTNKLLFVSGEKTIPPKFSSPRHLDQQTLRGVRELTAESASELDKLLPPIEQKLSIQEPETEDATKK